MEQPTIIGGTPEEQNTVRDRMSIAGLHDRLIDMKEKTPEQIELVDMTNRFIGKVMKDLELEYNPISLEDVHFFDSTTFASFTNKESTPKTDLALGHFNPVSHSISVNTEAIKERAQEKGIDIRLKELATLLHEGIHARGFLKYDIRNKIDNKANILPYRIGYQLNTYGNEELDIDKKFNGFNEGIIELLTAMILLWNKDEIKEKFGIDLTDKFVTNDKNSAWSYLGLSAVAEAIYVIYSRIKGQNFDQLWEGHFTGNMMHLREIERYYGKGTLRILSLLKVSDNDPDTITKINRFFGAKINQEERNAIAKELLGDHLD